MNRGEPQGKFVKCGRCDQQNPHKAGKELSDDVMSFLDLTQYDSLCPTCIVDLENLVKRAAENPLVSRGELIENVHYYMENGMMVFTEFYHIARGYCCKSGCRHCAYGYKPDI